MLRSPPWSDTGLSWNLSHRLCKSSFVLPVKDTELAGWWWLSSRRRTQNYQAGGGGEAGAEGIKTGAEDTEATYRSSSGKTSVQEPMPSAERGGKKGEHSPGSFWPLGKEYSWRGCSAAGGHHSLPTLTLHHHAGMPQTSPLTPAYSVPVVP